jgi:ABC-type oligopeptide transport system substrate-binding subunit
VVASALARTGAERPIEEGGRLLVNVTGTDLPSLDPAINYDTDGAQILYATCAKLFNYPDRRGPGGAVIEPEIASGMPAVSGDGRTYTFRCRAGSGSAMARPCARAILHTRFAAIGIRGCIRPQCHSCETWLRIEHPATR